MPLDVTLHGADKVLTAFAGTNFTCQAVGSRPPPVITWFLGDRKLAAAIETVRVLHSFIR